MRGTILLFLIVSVFCVYSMAKLGNVRYCRNHVRRCARNRFGELITKRLNESSNSTGGGGGGGGGGAGGNSSAAAPSDPGAAGSTRRRRDLILEDEDMASILFDTVLSRYKRQEPPAGNGTDPGAGGTAPGAGGADANGTAPAGTTTTTEPPSLPLPPPAIFTLTDLEETFYSCLGEMGITKCKLYMAQRCNWNNGKSTVLASYCRKWGIPCKPCSGGRG